MGLFLPPWFVETPLVRSRSNEPPPHLGSLLLPALQNVSSSKGLLDTAYRSGRNSSSLCTSLRVPLSRDFSCNILVIFVIFFLR